MSKRSIRNALVIASLVGSVLTPSGARAVETGATTITAPYDTDESDASCSSTPLTGSCDAQASSADASDGALLFDIGATSPRDGALPGAVPLSGTAAITARHALDQSVVAVLYTARVHVAHAAVVGSQVLALSAPRPTLSIAISHQGCQACAAQSSFALIDPTTGGSLDDHDVQIAALLFNRSGEDVPPGEITVRVSVDDSFLVLFGSARSTFVGTLLQIEASLPTGEAQALGAPFAAATGESSCSSDIGTVTSCKASGSKRTGASRLDLSATSPVAGTLPGTGSASGTALVAANHDIEQGTRALLYRVQYEVSSAEATVSSSSDIGGGSAWVSVRAEADGACASPGCTEPAAASLAGSPGWLIDEQVLLGVPVVKIDGETLPVSTVSIPIRADGFAALNHRGGIARASLDAHVAFVEVYRFA